MRIFTENFRVWWKKPADPTQRNIHREISMLELFYDLVYVAIMMQLTHLVAGHVNIISVGIYISVFLMILWAWFIGSLYHELHGNVDFKTRVIIFSQMLTLIGIGVFVHNVYGDGYKAFAFFYGLFAMIQCFLFWRTGVHDSEQKKIIIPFVRLLGMGVVSFFVSIFTPAKIAYILWFAAIFITIVYTTIFMMRTNPEGNSAKLDAIQDIGGSFVERLSLIVTILLGEGVISIVEGGSHIKHWGMVEVLDLVGCFALLVLLWLLYFDFISRRLPKDNNASKSEWLGLHFPLIGSIGLASAGLLNLVQYAKVFTLSDKLIVVVPLIVFLGCYLGLLKTIQVSEKFCPIFKNVYNETWFTLAAFVFIAFYPLGKTATLWSCVLCLTILFGSSFIMWIRMMIKNS